jgi:ATP-binding cassette subfamily B (MDR/TAP) protein 6
VKLYCGEAYEKKSFHDKIVDFQNHEWDSLASLIGLNTGQAVLITLGLLTGSMLCAYMVSIERKTLGDFVLFNTYLLQLYSPLNWFGTVHGFRQKLTLEDAISSHAVAPLEALLCVRPMPFISGVHCLIPVGTVNSVPTL